MGILCAYNNGQLDMCYTRADIESLSQKYVHWHARTRTQLHIAILYGRRGKVLGIATNRVGSRSRGAGFMEATIHAERAVLKSVGDVTQLRGATLVVFRINTLGQLGNSKPCHACSRHLEKAMKKYGLMRVYYS